LAAENRDDVLSWFVEGDDEHGDEALCDVVRSFLIARREMTSSTLIWFFWLISSRPD
jgi:cytochrome P450